MEKHVLRMRLLMLAEDLVPVTLIRIALAVLLFAPSQDIVRKRVRNSVTEPSTGIRLIILSFELKYLSGY